MSMSETYLDHLDGVIEIAPANSQEEVIAADELQSIFDSMGLEVNRQDVAAPNDTRFVTGVLFALMFVGVVVAGIGGIGLAVLGFVLVVLPGALLALKYLGNDVFARFMPPARSQNVIAFHKGEGPNAGRGVRSIVIMAHYDTGHEEVLANPSVARFSRYVYGWAPVGLAIAAVCSFLQLIVILPEPLLRVLWVVAILCAIPGLLWGINNIVAHFAPLSGAANDNNASLAAMFGVAEDVVGASDPARAERLEALRAAEAVMDDAMGDVEVNEHTPAVTTQPTAEVERVVEEPVEGVRHGVDILETLGILPSTCEIVYVQPHRTLVTETVETQGQPLEIPSFLVGGAAAPADTAEDQAGQPASSTGRLSPVDDTVSTPIPVMEHIHNGDDMDTRRSRDGRSYDDAGEREHANPFAGMLSTMKRVRDEVKERAEGVMGRNDGSQEAARGHEGFDDAVSEEEVDEFVEQPVSEAQADQPTMSSEPVAVDQPTMASEPVTAANDGSTMAMEMPQQPAAAPQAVDDPSWGQTSFTPHGRPVNIARRAALFDLPDPTEAAVDPLAPEPEPQNGGQGDESVYELPDEGQVPQAVRVDQGHVVAQTSTIRTRRTANGVSVSHSTVTVSQAPVAGPSQNNAIPIEPVQVSGAGEEAPHQTLRDRLRSRRNNQNNDSMADWLGVDEDYDAKARGEQIGSWDNFDDDGWKGGATRSAETRDGEDQGEDGELQEAVLDMDQANLVAHDIWFVAVGASELDHAGARAFVQTYRRDLRGAFLINLDAIGAGQLTLITEEGIGSKRKIDRRLLRTIDRVARDLHVPLNTAPRPWADTDATPAMRQSIRSATIMGCDPGEVAALAHTAENLPQNVSPDQVAQVNRIVSETIRRS